MPLATEPRPTPQPSFCLFGRALAGGLVLPALSSERQGRPSSTEAGAVCRPDPGTPSPSGAA
jgi:hypothetical protein